MKIPPIPKAFCFSPENFGRKFVDWNWRKAFCHQNPYDVVRSSSKIPAGVMLSTTGLGAWGFLLLGGSIVWKPRKLPPSVERTRETTAINRHFLDDSLCWTNRTHLESVKTCDVRFQCETAIFGCINNPYLPREPTDISYQCIFEDDVPFPQVGSVSSLEASCWTYLFLPCLRNWRPGFFGFPVSPCQTLWGHFGTRSGRSVLCCSKGGDGAKTPMSSQLLGKQSTVGD